MPLIKPYHQHIPQIHPTATLAENATIIGQVSIGAYSSVWYQAVLRGDVDAIIIGERTNIQDAAILHCSTDRTPCIVGNDVVIGHGAMLHGCTIEDEVLIGMGAIILDEALVPQHTIVAAGALVPEGKQLIAGKLYAGVPAKPIKDLTPAHIHMIQSGAVHYVQKGQEHFGSNNS